MFDKNGVLKLIDYGGARVDISQIQGITKEFEKVKQKFTLEVGTRWYKAPEMLLGGKEYNKAVDVWAIGGIFAELMKKEVLFEGMNDIEQIVMIIKTMGTPDEDTWPEFQELPDYPKLIFPESQGVDMYEYFKEYPESTVDFLLEFLQLNPENRIKIPDAMKHSYFDEILPLNIEELKGIPLFEKSKIVPDEEEFQDNVPIENNNYDFF